MVPLEIRLYIPFPSINLPNSSGISFCPASKLPATTGATQLNHPYKRCQEQRSRTRILAPSRCLRQQLHSNRLLANHQCSTVSSLRTRSSTSMDPQKEVGTGNGGWINQPAGALCLQTLLRVQIFLSSLDIRPIISIQFTTI